VKKKTKTSHGTISNVYDDVGRRHSQTTCVKTTYLPARTSKGKTVKHDLLFLAQTA